MNTTRVPDEEMFQHRPGHLVIASVVISFMVFVIWKVYRRHKSNMEPISLLQIHFLTELTLFTFWNIFLRSYGIEKMFSDFGAKCFCFVTNFLNYYITLSMHCSSSILQYEKYQYLYHKSSYAIQNDCQKAWDKILSSKFIIFFITLVGYYLDTEAQKCQKNEKTECNILTKNYVFWVVIPSFISFCFIYNVLRYAVKEKVRHEKEQIHKNQNDNIDNIENSKIKSIASDTAHDQIQSISVRVSPVQ